jgi:hypothetical protein
VPRSAAGRASRRRKCSRRSTTTTICRSGERRNGEGLNARGLGKLLRPYGIKSGTIRVDQATPKGYKREALADAWTRYLPPSPENPPQAPQATDPPREKPHEHWDVADVADVATNRGLDGNAATHAAPSHNRTPAASVGEASTEAEAFAFDRPRA